MSLSFLGLVDRVKFRRRRRISFTHMAQYIDRCVSHWELMNSINPAEDKVLDELIERFSKEYGYDNGILLTSHELSEFRRAVYMRT